MENIGASETPWEFNDMIPPSFQAWIAYGVTKSVTAVIGFYPHLIALILRIITAAFAIFSIDRFIKSNQWQVLPQNLLFFFPISSGFYQLLMYASAQKAGLAFSFFWLPEL